MLLDRPLRLTHGAGNGIDKACLMTCAAMLSGKGEQLDEPDCVCRVLRAFIVPTNDAMPLDLLGELYGPLAWEIIGTRTDDVDVMMRRAKVFADMAQELVASYAESSKNSRMCGRWAAASAMFYASHYHIMQACTFAAKQAANCVVSVALYHGEEWRRQGWTACRDAIRAAAAIGDKRPVECVVSPKQLCEMLD